MELLGGCFISKSHIDTTEDPEELPPPPPACGLKDGIRPYDLSCVACYATAEDGVGTYEDFVNARVSPYVKGDAPVELGIEGNSPDLGRGGMIDAEVVQACRKGDAKCVRLLLEHGADVAARDHENRTPLHDACAGGFESTRGARAEEKTRKAPLVAAGPHRRVTAPPRWSPRAARRG